MADVLLKNVRVGAFPDLWEPGKPPANSTSGPKYGGNFIFDIGSENANKAQAEFMRVATEKFGVNAPAILAELAKDKKCIRRGDGNLDKTGAVRNGYQGKLYIRASNKQRPLIVDRNKTPLVASDGRPYGGCYVNVVVDIYAHNRPGLGPRVDATLKSIQFYEHGEAFGGGTPATTDAFESYDDEGEATPQASAPAADTTNLFG